MKRHVQYLLFLVTAIFLFFSFSVGVFAQSDTSSPVIINAGILSDVWYSTTTSVTEKDTVSIYSAFQNQTNKTLTGTADFFVDDTKISSVDFIAGTKTLIKLETQYSTVSGGHSVQVKISKIQEAGSNAIGPQNLLAFETAKKDLLVMAPPRDIAQTVTGTLQTVYTAINNYANGLATQVESFRQPQVLGTSTEMVTTPLSNNSKNTTTVSKGKISASNPQKGSTTVSTLQNNGKATVNTDNGQKNETPGISTPFNMMLDIATFLILHWLWVFLAIIALYLISRFR